MSRQNKSVGSDQAIIGMACRFPGANNYRQFWQNIAGGTNSIREIPADRWDHNAFYSPKPEDKNKSISKWGGFLDQIDQFDARFFNISPREANNMDPQQRLLLEEAWHCVEDSGIALSLLQRKRTSVFVGVMAIDYHQDAVAPETVIDSYACLGNYECILANRISHAFGLTGLSMTLDTACSSSLVALHEARKSLLIGESDYALAAGVSLIIRPWKYVSFSKSRMLSPEGQCKTFDKDADGYVPGEGVGVLLLQPLERALEDGNHIYGILKGSAVNHTGRTSAITVPSVAAQRDLIITAYEGAGVSMESVGYIEAHGTGTSLGDPIEVEGLTQAFRRHSQRRGFCYIGSVKTNIGHLEAAAGVAGVIKVLLMMRHGSIVPTLNIKDPNPLIDFEASPFRLALSVSEWQKNEETGSRRAGVSSFGFGGVNAHVVLESVREPYSKQSIRGFELQDATEGFFILSAKSQKSLQGLISRWREELSYGQLQSHELQNVCSTLMTGRQSLPYRFGALVRNWGEVEGLVDAAHRGDIEIPQGGKPERKWVLRLRGHGALEESGFKRLCARDSALASYFEEGRELLAEVADALPAGTVNETRASLDDALKFLASHALARKLLETLAQPALIIAEAGSSLLALSVAGALDLKSALRRFMDSGSQPDMACGLPKIAIHFNETGSSLYPYRLDEAYLKALLDSFSIDRESYERVACDVRRLWKSQFTFTKYLEAWNSSLGQAGLDLEGLLNASDWTSGAARQWGDEEALAFVIMVSCLRSLNRKWSLSSQHHLDRYASELVELIVDGVLTQTEIVKLSQSRALNLRDIARAAHGRQLAIDSGKNYELLRSHSRAALSAPHGSEPTLSEPKSGTELPEDDMTVLEFGVAESSNLQDSLVRLDLSRNLERGFFQSLLNLWLAGIDVEWEKLVQGSRQKVSLPGYVFEGSRHWLKSNGQIGPAPASHQTVNSVDERWGKEPAREQEQGSRLLLAKEWVEARPVTESYDLSGRAFILLLSEENSAEIQRSFRQLEGVKWIALTRSDHYLKLSDESFLVNFCCASEGRRVMEEVLSLYPDIAGLIDCSDLSREGLEQARPERARLAFLQRLIPERRTEQLRLLHFTSGLKPYRQERPGLAGAWIAGLYPVLAAEYRHVSARSIDVDVAHDAPAILQILMRELGPDDAEAEVCYRSGARYAPRLRPVQAEARAQTHRLTLDAGKTYVVTGGTRGIGARIARHLVEKGARRLVLMGISPLPVRERWEELRRSTDPAMSAERKKIERFLALEEMGAQLMLYTGSLADGHRLGPFFEDARARLGPFGGVIHCAGLTSSEHPSFIRKSIEEMEAVFEPKIQGLMTLASILSPKALDFFILFSSVSAVVPALGVGMSDYACANVFMDLFAAHHLSRGARGVLSINWPSWREVGMGEIRSAKYEDLGFRSLPTEEALALFDVVVEQRGRAQLLPCQINPELFRPELLCRAKAEGDDESVSAQSSEASPPPSQQERGADVSFARAKEWLVTLFTAELNIPAGEFDEEANFAEYGVDSILLFELVKNIEAHIKGSLNPSLLLEHHNMNRLSRFLSDSFPHAFAATQSVASSKDGNGARGSSAPGSRSSNGFGAAPQSVAGNGSKNHAPSLLTARDSVAVIGVGCHFPGAGGAEQFWKNLAEGRSSITEVPGLRWDAGQLYSLILQKGKSISKWGGFIDNIDWFDPDYFGAGSVEPSHIDPLERQFLEVSAEALAHAGYQERECWGRKVGVFVGSRVSNYASRIMEPSKNSIVGIGQNFIAAHVSHVFNFAGPNLVVDTACSSSLVSLHLACQSLQTGECEMALAGGVDILLDEQLYLILTEAKALSPDGKCHTFDIRANGFVPGEGCGAVLLKPLKRAVADGDAIYAVIDASAVNNDGHTMGITTPSLEGQQAVIAEALTRGGINPADISYIEAHGTGTMIGDPIELKALTTVFRKYTEESQFCAIGSVKTNLGHLLSAAGIAGLIKVVLSLHHKKIPPTLNCETPNPRFDFQNSPFYPNVSLQEWKARRGVRRAAISSFGFGGTNSHAIVSEFEAARFAQYECRRAPLAPPRFNRKRYWLEAPSRPSSSPSTTPLPLERQSGVEGFVPLLTLEKI